MTSFLRKNGKIVLAVLGAILAITLVLPPSWKGGMSGDASQRLIGTTGDVKIFDTDVTRAKNQWDFLEHVIVTPSEESGQMISIAENYRRTQQGWFIALWRQVSEHPELYLMLQLEAERMGIIIMPEQVDAIFPSERWAIRMPDSGTTVFLNQIGDEGLKNRIRDAAVALVRVRQALDRGAMAIKISRPERQARMATQLQELRTQHVMFSAKEILDKIEKPSEEQLRAHFDAFSKYIPNRPSVANPHGFGYMYPNRVTMHYVGVNNADVREVVRAGKTAYAWKVDAYKEYQRNPGKFRAPPTTSPTTQDATSQPVATPATAPTTRPFEEVSDQIVESLITPLVATKAREVQSAITGRLLDDWNAWRAQHPEIASPTTVPTTAAATQPGESGFTSYAYVQKLADDVQKQTGVRPVTGAVNQLSDTDALNRIPGLGSSKMNEFPFSEYATAAAEAMQPPNLRDGQFVLKLYQPSQAVKDADGSIYIFRLTAGAPAAVPQSMAEVAEAVDRDWKMLRAYERTKERGQALIESAKKLGSLSAATAAENLAVIEIEKFDANSNTPASFGHTDDPTAWQLFRGQALALLSTAATQPTGPVLRLIELPPQNEIAVAQLISATPKIDVVGNSAVDAYVESELRREWATPIMQSWFDYQNVSERIGWQEHVPPGAKRTR